MSLTLTQSTRARTAYTLVQDLQTHLLQRVSFPPDSGRFETHTWLRDGGRHGGGLRRTYAGGERFNRASLNVSHVHYDDMPDRGLSSASAISSIVHPMHPRAPSVHLHISWTELKAGDGFWRVMADLNPSIVDEGDTVRFRDALRNAAGDVYDAAAKQGDRYFHIPVLGRHRGVAHFYLEQYRTADEAADRELARRVAVAAIDAYGDILRVKLSVATPPTAAEQAEQRAYHTLYLLQVLTLDRGTTSGLLVHDQNDLGILGSLPARVDKALLASWVPKLPKPQDELLRAIVAAIPADGAVNDAEKLALCRVMRQHYAAHPAALEMQARGDTVPPTVLNHGRTSG